MAASPSKKPTRRRKAAANEVVAPAPSRLKSLARGVQSLTNSMLGMADTATDLTVALAKSRLKTPRQRAAIEKAGAVLHDLRNAAGLTVQEFGHALGLDDSTEVVLFETGKIAMPFELVLRAAAVLGRNDPLTFVMQFTRAYNPEIWKTLEGLGIGRLVVQGAREREFANIYRSHDAGRALSDAEFADALVFVNSAWELALAYKGRKGRKAAPPASG